MFEIGFWEIGIIALIALLVLGPKRLPEAARTAGRWAGRLRTFINNVKQDLDRQLQVEELAELKRLKAELSETRQVLQESTSTLMDSFTSDGSKGSESLLSKVNKAVSGSQADAIGAKPSNKVAKKKAAKRKTKVKKKQTKKKPANKKTSKRKSTKSKQGTKRAGKRR